MNGGSARCVFSLIAAETLPAEGRKKESPPSWAQLQPQYCPFFPALMISSQQPQEHTQKALVSFTALSCTGRNESRPVSAE